MTPRARDPLGELRIADVTTFLTVCRYGSVTSAARALEVTPSQVSKSIARLEKQLRLTLLQRNARGVSMSESAARVLPSLEAIANQVRLLGQPSEASQRELVVASPSALLGLFLPPIATALGDWKIRGLQLGPAAIRASIGRNLFDVAIGCGSNAPSEAWVSEKAGDLRMGVLASPPVLAQLGGGPVTPEELKKLPFITPLKSDGGQVAAGSDDCPLSLQDRLRGHEVETFDVAMELAARSEQVVFGPIVAARRLLTEGRLVELPVEGWDVREALYVFLNKDRVTARVGRDILRVVRSLISGNESESGAELASAATH